VFYEDVGFWKAKTNPAGGRCQILDGNLEFGELSPHVIGYDSEEEETEPDPSEDRKRSDGTARKPEVPDARAKSRKKPWGTIGEREMKGLASHLGKAWEHDGEEPSQDDGAERREAIMDYVGMVEAGPSSAQEAMESKERSEWESAIKEEIANLERLKTWIVVDKIPDGCKPITSRLVLQRKLNAEGSHDRYKARLVAHGFKQQPGVDFVRTYAPLVSMSTVRLILSFAAVRDYEIHQLDVVTAFLESRIKEEIYLQLPIGFSVVDNAEPQGYSIAYTGELNPIYVRILRSLYGLRQAALNWYERLDYELRKSGFRKSTWEAGVYFWSEFIFLVWVDDILLVGGSDEVKATRKILQEAFTIRDMGPISHFLGLRIERNRLHRTLTIDQEGYVNQMLRRFHMEAEKGVSTPIEPGTSLLRRKGTPTVYPESEHSIHIHINEEEEREADQKEYQEIVGSLNYAAIATLPDISFAIGVLGRFASDPAKRHMTMAIGVMRYLKKTSHLRLQLGQRNEESQIGSSVVLYTDSDFAGDPNSLKSTTGMLLQDRYGSTVAWHSKKQTITAKSTADAEFIMTATSTYEAVWVHKIDIELHSLPHLCPQPYIPLHVYSDNQANVQNANIGIHQTRSKTVGVKFHWLIDQVNDGTITITLIPTTAMLADGFTKPYGRLKQEEFILKLGLTRC